MGHITYSKVGSSTNIRASSIKRATSSTISSTMIPHDATDNILYPIALRSRVARVAHLGKRVVLCHSIFSLGIYIDSPALLLALSPR